MKLSLFILSLFIVMASACAHHNKTPEAGEVNALASLPDSFNFSKMGLKVITSTVNKKLGTMSTLYGNDSAKAGNGRCLPGAVYALVTWKQQPDKRWIGGNIPGNLLSVEMLKATADKPNIGSYSRFTGSDLTAVADTSGSDARTKYILGLKASVMF